MDKVGINEKKEEWMDKIGMNEWMDKIFMN